MFENVALRGLLSVMGAFLISLSVGLMYLWGIIILYATSYFRLFMFNKQLTEDHTDIVFPLTLLGQAISIPFVTRYAKKVSSGMTCFVSGIAMSFVIYLSSYTQNFTTFAFLFGLCNGMIIGVIYILPVGHCYQFFPRKKSMISGIITSASGIGTLIFALIAYNCMNPDNQSFDHTTTSLYYGKQIAMKFPDYLKILSGITLAFVSGGGLLLFQYPANLQSALQKQLLADQKKDKNLSNLMDLQFVLQMQNTKQTQKNPFGNMNYQLTDISKSFDQKTGGKVYGQRGDNGLWASLQYTQNQYKPPVEHHHHDQNKKQNYAKQQSIQSINQCPRTSDGPRECIFWNIFLIIILGANFGLMISVNYRTVAKAKILDDKYLGFIGSIGAVACGFSRFIWGSFLQKKTFKPLYYFLSVLNALLAFSVYFIIGVKQIYFVYVILAYICYGGHLGMFPAITSSIFGVRYGPQIYGLLFYAFPLSNFIQYLLVNYVSQGYFIIFKISGVMSICALLVTKKIQLDYDWSQRIRQHNQRKRLMAR